MINTKGRIELAVGPMSTEIIEATFSYSHKNSTPLMLIASKNQIDRRGGYVNGWTTKEYMQFVRAMRKKYPKARVRVCRDHCGPGFNGKHDLSDTYATIEDDIKQGFDLIHIDFCHFQGSKKEKLQAAKKAVLHCLKLKPSIKIEIGTDENTGKNLPSMKELEQDIDFFKSFCKPEYYVVQTGSVIKEIDQAGGFNTSFVKKASSLVQKKGLKLKEHNADYLLKNDIRKRRGIVDAQNIAPQLGVVQTQLVLTKCLIYGVPIDDFIETVHKGGKWKKWMYKNSPENKMLTVMIAGHYHFTSPAYKHIIQELEKREDIKASIMSAISDVIHHYTVR